MICFHPLNKLFTKFPGTLRGLLLVPRRPASAPDAVPVDGDDGDVPRGTGLVEVDGGLGPIEG